MVFTTLKFLMMKKIILLLTILFYGLLPTNAQTLYSNNFDGPDPFADMTIYDLDGNTPFFPAEFTYEWEVRYNYVTLNNNAICGSSFVEELASADDWLITPALEIPSEDYILKYDVKAALIDIWYEISQYEVLVSTTGTAVQDFIPIFMEEHLSGEDFITKAISLDDFAGETIHIAFRNTCIASFALMLDNISVELFEDNQIQAVTFDKEHLFTINESIEPTFEFRNMGGNPIQSIEAIAVIDGETYTETFTGLDVGPLETEDISFSAIVLDEAKQYDFTCTFSNPNGQQDTDSSDNTAVGSYYAVAESAEDRVVIGEVSQGTDWCDTCPEGYAFINNLGNQLPDNFIPIAVHGGDTLMLFDYVAQIPNFNNYPITHLNRTATNIPFNLIDDVIDAVRNTANPFHIIAEEEKDLSSNTVTISATATSTLGMDTDDFRFSLLILEDNLSGTSSDWAQDNRFAGGNNGPMFGFENLPDPVPADQMVYNHVIRDFVGEVTSGIPNTINAINAGEEFTFNYEYEVPDFINIENTRIIVVIIDKVTGEIMNAGQAPVDDNPVSTVDNVSNSFAKIFPNPVDGLLFLELDLENNQEVQVEISDLSGRLIHSQMYNHYGGQQRHEMNVSSLNSGMYLLKISTDENSFSEKLIVTH